LEKKAAHEFWRLGMRTQNGKTMKDPTKNPQFFLYHLETKEEINLEHLLLSVKLLTDKGQVPVANILTVLPDSFDNKEPLHIVEPGKP
jgi:hypothetical protein